MLPSVLPRLTTDSVVVFGNFSPFKTPFLGWSFIPTSFVSFFVFYIFSYLLLKTMGCFSGCLMSSAGEGNGTPLQYSCLENPMD